MNSPTLLLPIQFIMYTEPITDVRVCKEGGELIEDTACDEHQCGTSRAVECDFARQSVGFARDRDCGLCLASATPLSRLTLCHCEIHMTKSAQVRLSGAAAKVHRSRSGFGLVSNGQWHVANQTVAR
ncbi:MAG: hypothetical protein IPO08_22735 [Xanthomonadales bacterium]|nr:hypothetical protein [Xanthomonadales bacterium]